MGARSCEDRRACCHNHGFVENSVTRYTLELASIANKPRNNLPGWQRSRFPSNSRVKPCTQWSLRESWLDAANAEIQACPLTPQPQRRRWILPMISEQNIPTFVSS